MRSRDGPRWPRDRPRRGVRACCWAPSSARRCCRTRSTCCRARPTGCAKCRCRRRGASSTTANGGSSRRTSRVTRCRCWRRPRTRSGPCSTALSETIPLSSPDQIELAVRRYRRAPNRPTAILADASFDIVSVLEEHRVEFPGLIIQSAPKRHYPDGAAVAVVRRLHGRNHRKRARLAHLPRIQGRAAGRQGRPRKEYEDTLARHARAPGSSKSTRVAVWCARPARARTVSRRSLPPALHQHRSRPAALHRVAVRRLAPGGAIALDPDTGEVLALHSAPTFDPNRFIGGIPADYWRDAEHGPAPPAVQQSHSGAVSPGLDVEAGDRDVGARERHCDAG